MATGHRVAIVLTPLIAIATLAVGMRIGAKRTVHAAVVEGAPRARDAATFAWQVVTMVADTGGRETEPRAGVTIHARAQTRLGERDATWRGDTNEDGVAEVRLELPGVERGDPIDLEVLGEGLNEPLAVGRAQWDDEAWMEAAPGPFLRTSRRIGAIALDVAVLGGKLVVRNDVPLLIRATSRDDGHPIENVVITPEPEPGLDVRQPVARTCALGWAALDVAPKIYVAALGLRAKAADGRTGEWFSGLPVATGSIRAILPDSVQAGQTGQSPQRGQPGQAGQLPQSAFDVRAQTGAYVEVDDDEGRAFGGWAKLPSASGDRASFPVPPLTPGLKWFVTSSEPRAAELPDEATILRPFLVLGSPMPPGSPPSDDPCALIAYLALHPAGGFHRSTLLDGFISRKDTNGARRKRGLAIGLGSLAVAAVLELLLLLQSARSGRALSADAIEGVDDRAALLRRSSAGSVVVGLLLALLGFGLIAALLLLQS